MKYHWYSADSPIWVQFFVIWDRIQSETLPHVLQFHATALRSRDFSSNFQNLGRKLARFKKKSVKKSNKFWSKKNRRSWKFFEKSKNRKFWKSKNFRRISIEIFRKIENPKILKFEKSKIFNRNPSKIFRFSKFSIFRFFENFPTSPIFFDQNFCDFFTDFFFKPL